MMIAYDFKEGKILWKSTNMTKAMDYGMSDRATITCRLVKQIASNEGVTEQPRGEDQMEWVIRVYNIHNSVNEIIDIELIYT